MQKIKRLVTKINLPRKVSFPVPKPLRRFGAMLGRRLTPLSDWWAIKSLRFKSIGYFMIALFVILLVLALGSLYSWAATGDTVTQANYRLYQNADSVTPVAPLAAQDTAASVAAGDAFRLRQRLAVDNFDIYEEDLSFKLQYAEKIGTCDPSFSGESYQDIQGGVTTIPSGNMTRPASITGSLSGAPYQDSSWVYDNSSVTMSDNSYATISTTSTNSSNYLTSGSHGFTLPSDTTITGVELQIERSTDDDYYGITSSAIHLIKGGAVVGTNMANELQGSDSWGSGADFVASFGGPSELWGTTWTPEDINSNDFGAAIAVYMESAWGYNITARVDEMKIIVYHTGGTAQASGDIVFYDNPNTNGDGYSSNTFISSEANDPTNGARTTVPQSYYEVNGFTNFANPILDGQDGMWDFALAADGNAVGDYCVRVVHSDGSPLESYAHIAEVIVGSANTTPATPSLSGPSDGATGASVTPTFSFKSTDADGDYLQYYIDLCSDAACNTILRTINQTSSQTGWTGQDQQGNTAYTGASSLASSTLASYTLQTPALSYSTTYYWRAYAIDPGGTNTWSSASGVRSFTTGSGVAAPKANDFTGGVEFRGGSGVN